MPRITVARLRRAGRRETWGVDVAGSLNLVGTLLTYLSLAFLFPTAVALWYREPAWPFIVTGGIAAALGLGMQGVWKGKERVGTREGFLVVALTWLLAAAFGSLPYVFAEPQLSRPADALFEGMSGFTTTGASVVVDIPALDKSMAMYRQFTQWLGGMGIIVLALAVLPRLRVGGRQLFETEAPGPEIEGIATRIRDTARRLWMVYVGLTVLLVTIFVGFGLTGIDEEMDLYEAVSHAFGILPTGGFSTQARSFEGFAPASQWAAVAFMVASGVNYALLFAAFVRRRPRALARDEEFRLYIVLLTAGSALLLAELLRRDLYSGEEAIRHAVFQAVSTMTTTGVASADYTTWGALAAVVLVGLMFFGGSAGSTTGSVKIVRHLIVGRQLRREIDQTLHPEAVLMVRYNGRIVEDRAVRGVITFVLLYVGLFALGALALMVDTAFNGPHVTPFETISASASMLGNVGPAFGFAGPMGSFEPYSDVSIVIMTVLMWLGRLEIIPVVVLLTKAYWRA